MTEPTFRPTTLDDADLAADLMTAAYPSFAVDPVLTRYRWAGNVRELENAIERACALCDDVTIKPSDLPPQVLAIRNRMLRSEQFPVYGL